MNKELIETIGKSVIGGQDFIETSFGSKPLVYADYTASGRSLSFIEDYIRHHVMPAYANSHTETSYTGAQTTAFREQARQIIHQAVNGSDDDIVLFCGAGATAAINKLIDILNLRLPAKLDKQYGMLEQIPIQERPIVFIGPYEHHSNELPWRESIADVEVISLNHEGHIDLNCLEEKLIKYQSRRLKIGSFSAASNVTGIKTDINRVTDLLKKYDALSFWDYAAAAPYIGIDMNPQEYSEKDAVFISPHKFIGGPGTPGILIVKKHLLDNEIPSVPGGGTVLYVSPTDHIYVDNRERREEGGTPAIIETIRAGLVFKLQQAVGVDNIEARETQYIQRAIKRWQELDNIEILGNPKAESLAIVSLRIKHQDKYLHYGFVTALLNDLFGIQVRGGCSCAGPYAHTLLDLDEEYSKKIASSLLNGDTILRPGWVRLNFNYFIDEESFHYISEAMVLVAQYGWKLLPYYHFDKKTGVWCYQNKKTTVKKIQDIDFLNINVNDSAIQKDIKEYNLAHFLRVAEEELQRLHRDKPRYSLHLPEDIEDLCWFTLPQQIDMLSQQPFEHKEKSVS